MNDIYVTGDTAVLSCNFGVIIFDLKKEVVLIDVQFNTNQSFDTLRCQSSTIFNGKYYFATNNGLFSIPTNQNIKNLSIWTKETSFPDGFYKRVKTNNNKLYALYSKLNTNNTSNQDTIFVTDGISKSYFNNGFNKTIIDFDLEASRIAILYPTIIDILNVNTSQAINSISNCVSVPVKIRIHQNQYFALDNWSGLKLIDENNPNCSWITISGPPTSKVFDLSYNNGTLWAVTGAISSLYGNVWEEGRLYYYKDNAWTEVPLPSNYRDIFKVYCDPLDPGHVFASSWVNGLIEVKNYNEITVYANGVLDSFQVGTTALYRAGGVIYDEDRNLWVPNSNTSILMKKMQPNGTWLNYPFSTIVPNNSLATMVEIDERGNLWIAFPGRGVGYFNPTTNQRRLFNMSFNNGNLPDLNINSIKKDKSGQVWVGTRNGFRKFSASQASQGGAINAQAVIIKADDGNNEIVLNQTVINEIEVDDANRKWIATEGSGILVLNEFDEIERTYTVTNSELLDNNVRAIEFDRQKGYVYIATSKGLMALRQEATEADEFEFADQVYAYPNPVKPTWDGPITVKGLAENARVKITDTSGNIVFETRALGGQVVWNGKSYNGTRVSTGVYLVFAINNVNDGNKENLKTMVTKILFIN